MLDDTRQRALDLLLEYQSTGDPDTLRQSVALYRRVTAAMSPDDPDAIECLGNLSVTLSLLWRYTGELGLLTEATQVCRRVAALVPAGHPEYATCQNNLSRMLVDLFEQDPDVTLLPDAVTAARNAVPGDGPDRPDALLHLGNRLRLSYEWVGELAELREAVAVIRDAVAGCPPEHPVYTAYLTYLAIALRLVNERTEELPPLREAVAVSRQAIDAAGGGSNHMAARTSLCNALRRLAEQTSDRGAADEALDIARGLVVAHPEGDANHALALNILAATLRVRYEYTNDLAALREAVAAARDAVEHTPPPYLYLGTYRANLVTVLRMLADATDDSALAREAVLLGLETDSSFREDDPERLVSLNALNAALVSLGRRTNDRQALEAAVSAGMRALRAITPQHSRYVPVLFLLCNNLVTLYRSTLERSWLDMAVRPARDAAGATPQGHPYHAKALTNLSVVLAALSTVDGKALDEAVGFARDAVAATAPGDPDRITCLMNLGHALRGRFDATQDPIALREARSTYAAVTRRTEAMAAQRVAAARLAVQLDLAAGERHRAMRMIESAVPLVPLLALRDVDRADREYRVSTAHQLAATAAAVAIAADNPNRAVELLEQTRGLIFAGTLDTRGDLTELRERAPDLARPFDELSAAINDVDHESSAAFGADVTALAAKHRELAARRAELNDRWDRCLADIRQRDGLAGFLRPPPIDELRRQAGFGPIVYLTVHEHQGHALIVRDDPDRPVQVVALPDAVSRAAVIGQVDDLRTARWAAGNTGLPVAERRAAQQRIHAVLEWTWDAVAEPVLRHIVATDPLPRVWWCPVGVLTFLPLHAAGHHRATPRTDTVLDRVISSYTPTIRALAHARGQRPAPASTVVVVVPDAPGSAPLDGAIAEAEIVRELVPTATVLPPPGARTSHDAVTAALREHTIVHLACHGTANLANPAASRLLLHDHQTNPLTLHKITRLRLAHAQLAYLSACSTTDNSPTQADEATHITGAFHLAGYRGVIGTLWPINDRTAIDIARDVYIGLTNNGTTPPDPDRAAVALHAAIRHQRDAATALPTRWASHIHTGT